MSVATESLGSRQPNMDESISDSTNAEYLASPSDDECAIRRAVHDLGSDDFEVRAIARTFILSAGQVAMPVLLGELRADKLKSRSIAQRVALMVAGIVLIGPTVGIYFSVNWLVPASNISACLALLFACLLFRRPPWYHEASKLLARYDGHEVTRAMIEALTDVWGEEQPRLRAAIINRLAKVTPDDVTWLRGETRERVIALLSMPNWDTPNCVDHILIIARALGSVGATEAIPVLKGVNCASLSGERHDRLQSGIDEVVRLLEEQEAREETAQKLLRAAPEEAIALVRPVEGTRDTDPNTLLQSVGESDSPGSA
jgi:hypothetical protein